MKRISFVSICGGWRNRKKKGKKKDDELISSIYPTTVQPQLHKLVKYNTIIAWLGLQWSRYDCIYEIENKHFYYSMQVDEAYNL
jgi:hypothetical protein